MKNRLQGKIEEITGRLTGDRAMVAKGKARQTLGNVEQTAKEVRHDVEHRDDENRGGRRELLDDQ